MGDGHHRVQHLQDAAQAGAAKDQVIILLSITVRLLLVQTETVTIVAGSSELTMTVSLFR